MRPSTTSPAPSPTPSRLLARLDAAIARAVSPLEAACLQAERAALRARQGHLDEARSVVCSLQPQAPMAGARRRPLAPILSAWLMVADGLVDHYSALLPAARDKLARAHEIATLARIPSLQALTAAWLAHMDYVRNDTSSMLVHVRRALTLAEPEHHAARARANLVVAQAYHFGGQFERAQPWYQRARHHANAEGDETTLSALMHNMAWLHGTQAREAQVFGEVDDAERDARLRLAAMGADSTGHFDAGVGTASLASLVPMLRALLMVLRGEHDSALALYEAHLDEARRDGLTRMEPCFLADMAWCQLQLGRSGQALDSARAALAAVEAHCDIDDRAVALQRVAHVFDALGLAPDAERARRRAVGDWQAHRATQRELLRSLDEALAPALSV